MTVRISLNKCANSNIKGRDLNVPSESMKLLSENIWELLQDTGVGRGSLDKVPKAQKIKAKIELGIHATKKLPYNKGYNRVKRKSTEWVKMLAYYAPVKVLIHRLLKK
jgi:hypothetical protein